MNEPAVDIKGLSLTFTTADGQVEALRDASLTIDKGEFVSIIGPSGCGKTSLLRLIADLEQPTSGTVQVNGMSARAARERRAYGYVFQSPSLFPWRTVRQNITLPLQIAGYAKTEQDQRALETLSLVGLSEFSGKYPWQLSGGMQQRVSIARALAFDADILLMDEPFGALDEMTRDHLNEQLLSLWRGTGKTVVFVTHSISEAVYLSTRVAVMTRRPGRITETITSTLPLDRSFDIRESAEFTALAQRVRNRLRSGERTG